MDGLEILVRTLSKPVRFKDGQTWNYHSRSDRHSKVACWCIVFDLLRNCGLFRGHVGAQKVGFGINHRLTDFRNDRAKNLDLVICTPAHGIADDAVTLVRLAEKYDVQLTPDQSAELVALPRMHSKPVGGVLAALEAKACMTEHQKALPRLYDELNSSHLIVHGAIPQAIAAGFVMINAADSFLSPGRNPGGAPRKWNFHAQPKSTIITVEEIERLPRRSRAGEEGYDALAIGVVECPNDGSPLQLVTAPPAPQLRTTYHYSSMIERLCHVYSTRFGHL